MNEVIQWLVLVILTVLVLGILRQISLSIPPVRRADEAGPFVGTELPDELLSELVQVNGSSGHRLIAFVTENCIGCQRLLANVEASPPSVRNAITLVARTPSDGFRRALGETGAAVIHDSRGAIWDACRVTTTPLLLEVDSDNRVQAKEVTHRAEWLTVAAEDVQ